MEIIEERHNKYIVNAQEKYSQKLADNLLKYHQSLQKVLIKKEEEEKEKEQKAIKKYEGYVK